MSQWVLHSYLGGESGSIYKLDPQDISVQILKSQRQNTWENMTTTTNMKRYLARQGENKDNPGRQRNMCMAWVKEN